MFSGTDIAIFIIIAICVCFFLFAPNKLTVSAELHEKTNPWKFVALIVCGLAFWFYFSSDNELEQPEHSEKPRWHRGLFDGG